MKSLISIIFLFSVSKLMSQSWQVYTSVSANQPTALYNILSMDTEGSKKWFGVPGFGLVKYDANSWYLYNSTNSLLTNDTILSVVIDNLGNKWIGTQGNGLVKLDNNGLWTTFNTSNSNIPHNTVSSISIDSSGQIWIGTMNGLAKFNGINWTVYTTTNSGLTNDYIRSTAIDNNGNIWIITINGISKFNGTNWATYNSSNSGILNDYIYEIEVHNNDVWFGTQIGLTKYDGADWVNHYQTVNSSIPLGNIYAIEFDNDNIMWVGGGSGGFSKFDGNVWTNFNYSNSALPSDNVRSIMIDSNNTKWIGTFWGLVAYNENQLSTTENVEIETKESIIVYPNPSGDYIFLKIPSNIDIKSVEIFDSSSNKINSPLIKEKSNKVDVTHLPTGIYILKININGKYLTKKFVKK